MKDEILSYHEMCSRENMALQRGMNFRPPPAMGIILMSRRPNAPYNDDMSDDGSEILYEGHDAHRTKATPNPKVIDQPRYGETGKPTPNGLFADWVDKTKAGTVGPATFIVYEKMITGVWTDRGPYQLIAYTYPSNGTRHVFQFRLKQASLDQITNQESQQPELSPTRQIPSSIKQIVFKRDRGRCVICGKGDQLHFDHDLPYSRGGTSISAENVRILCARHNLQKGANIQ